MKDQYFGDVRDYDKYSLLVDILDNLPDISTFAFVPLLTPDEHKRENEGNKRSFEPGTGDPAIYQFLREWGHRRDISLWRKQSFFKNRYPYINFQGGILDDAPSRNSEAEYFTDTSRHQYFQSVSEWKVQDGLLFFDPDIGLGPVDPKQPEKYVHAPDLKQVAASVENSVLMVYQHLQFNRHMHAIDSLGKLKIMAALFGNGAATLRYRDVQFLLVASCPELQARFEKVLQAHAERRREQPMTIEFEKYTGRTFQLVSGGTLIESVHGSVFSCGRKNCEMLALWMKSGFSGLFTDWWRGFAPSLKHGQLMELVGEEWIPVEIEPTSRLWKNPQLSLFKINGRSDKLKYIYLHPNPTDTWVSDSSRVAGMAEKALETAEKLGVKSIAMNGIQGGLDRHDESQDKVNAKIMIETLSDWCSRNKPKLESIFLFDKTNGFNV